MKRLVAIALALALAVLAQSYFARKVAPQDALLLFAIAGVIMAVAIGARLWPEAGRMSFRPPFSKDSILVAGQGRLALAGAALLSLVAGLQMYVDWNKSLFDGALLLVIAGVIAAYGFSRLEGWTFSGNVRAVLVSLVRERGTTLALLAIVAFAAWMRLGRIDYYPPANGVGFVDEAQFGKIIVDIMDGQRPWMFLSSIYPAALFMKLFGMSMLTLRLPFALFGVAMIIPFYLLARLMVGRGPALAATLLFAASRWDATVNRGVLPAMPESLIGLLAFYFLYRALRNGGGMSFVLAGVFSVLGLYGYAAFRIVPVIIFVLISATLLVSALRVARARAADERTSARQELLGQSRGFALFLFAAFVFLLPYLGIVARDPHNAFTERFTSVIPVATAEGRAAFLPTLGERFLSALYLFNYRGDGSAMFNIPGMPMLDPVTGILFALALGCCLFYVWKGHTLLPVAWFGLTLVGGAVLSAQLQAYRIQGITPSIYLLIAFLLEGLDRLARSVLKGRRMLLVTIPVWALLLVGAYWNAHLFFDVQISDAAVRREYLHSTEITAAYIAKQTDKPYVHLIGNSAFYKYGMDFAWLAGFPRGDRDLSLSSALPHRFDDEAALYVFMPPYSDGEPAKVVSAFYPNATCENELAPWGDQFYIACRVSAQDVQGMRGLTARYRSGAQEVVRKDAALNLGWGAGAAPLSGVFSAEWEGAIYIPAYGPMTLGVESTAPFSVTIDGVTLSTLSAAERNLTLYQGWHAIRASLSGATSDGVTRLYRVVDGKRQPFGPESFAAFSPANGLYGRIYAGAAWQGAVMAERFDPFMDMFANPETAETRPGPTLAEGPFSAEWTATLLIERDGLYRFRAGAISGMSELTIDGKKVAATAVADYNQSISGDGEITLAPGQHTLRFRYSYNRGQMARCWLYWSPPGDAMGQIPYQVLTPIRP